MITLLKKTIFQKLDLGDTTQKGTKQEVKKMFKTNKASYIQKVTNAALLLEKGVKEKDWAEKLWALEKKLFEVLNTNFY